MDSVSPPFHILPVRSPAACAEVEEIQRRAWNLADDALEIVPKHQLMAFAHNSGIVLGCHDATGRMVGFVYSFCAFEDGPAGRMLKQHSHQMAVLPEARGQQLGRMLKLAQREATLAQGLRLITWTYDPLEPVNARLNIGQLRAIARRYHRDFYGELGGINAGIPTDRFEVEWWLDTARVHSAEASLPGPPSFAGCLAAGLSASGLPTPGQAALPLDGQPFALEVPASFQQLKQADPGLALAWRLFSRSCFEQAFAAGYAATEAWAAGGRAFYGLTKELF
jgi:predicted GNAT superfamily acetyltransferase